MEQKARVTNAFQLGLTGGLGVLVALVIGAAVSQTATILTYVGIALFVALGLDPIVRILMRRNIPRPFAVSIVVAGFLATIALFLLAVIPAVVQEAGKLIARIPEIVETVTGSQFVALLDSRADGIVSKAVDNGLEYLMDSTNWPSLVGGVLQVGIGLLGGVVGLIIVVILSVYFMASLEGMKTYTGKLVKASKRERFLMLTDQVTLSVGRWVIGQVAVALLHAFMLFLFLTIIQAPFALLLGSISFFIAIIPLIGSTTAGVLTATVLLFTAPELVLPVVIYYLIYLQLEAYIIGPRVMKKAVSVPASLVVIAALMGGTLLGILGAVVAIPLAASVLLIVREVWMPRQEAK